MVAGREMGSCSAAKRQHLDASVVRRGNDMRREILDGSGLETKSAASQGQESFITVPVHQESQANTWLATHALGQALP